MSITTQMQPRPGFTVPERFAALVTNLAAFADLASTNFMVGPAPVELWRPREGHWVLNLQAYTYAEDDPEGDPYATHTVRSVAIVPGAERQFEVRRFEGDMTTGYLAITVADCHSVEAALGIALDEVTKPVWQPPMVAAAMNEHNENGC